MHLGTWAVGSALVRQACLGQLVPTMYLGTQRGTYVELVGLTIRVYLGSSVDLLSTLNRCGPSGILIHPLKGLVPSSASTSTPSPIHAL